jgi:hypothetical protein
LLGVPTGDLLEICTNLGIVKNRGRRGAVVLLARTRSTRMLLSRTLFGDEQTHSARGQTGGGDPKLSLNLNPLPACLDPAPI